MQSVVTRQHLLIVLETTNYGDDLLGGFGTKSAFVNFQPLGCDMPAALRQLPLFVPLLPRDIFDVVPADVLGWGPYREPEALHVVPCLRVDVGHVSEEEFFHHETVEIQRVLLDRVFVDGKESSGLEAHRGRYRPAWEEYLPIFGGGPCGVHTLHRGPLHPAGVFFPWNTIPVVEGLQLTEREGGDLARLGLERVGSYLTWAHRDVVVDTALEEDCDVGERVVVLDDMVKIGVPLPADVGDGMVWEGGGVLLAALGVDDALVHVVGKPGHVFIVVSYHNVHARLRRHVGRSRDEAE